MNLLATILIANELASQFVTFALGMAAGAAAVFLVVTVMNLLDRRKRK